MVCAKCLLAAEEKVFTTFRYWYCPTCKDEVKEALLVLDEGHLNELKKATPRKDAYNMHSVSVTSSGMGQFSFSRQHKYSLGQRLKVNALLTFFDRTVMPGEIGTVITLPNTNGLFVDAYEMQLPGDICTRFVDEYHLEPAP